MEEGRRLVGEEARRLKAGVAGFEEEDTRL